MQHTLRYLALAMLCLGCNNGRFNLLDSIGNLDYYQYCKAASKCSTGDLTEDIEMHQCFDELKDGEHLAVAYGCGEEYAKAISCEKEYYEEKQCRSDYSSYEDYREGEYTSTDSGYIYEGVSTTCESKQEDLNECLEEFLYGDDDNACNACGSDHEGGWDSGA